VAAVEAGTGSVEYVPSAMRTMSPGWALLLAVLRAHGLPGVHAVPEPLGLT
jgi:hypothetical protein